MPYIERKIMPFGMFANRTRIKRQSKSAFLFSSVERGWNIKFYTNSNVFLGYLAVDIKEPILSTMRATNDLRGCSDAVIQLVENPPFPIPTYSKVEITYNGACLYTGYVWKPQREGTTKNDLFKYEFFGLRKKYEKTPINLTKYSINGISKSGSNITYTISGSVPSGTIAGQKIGARNCQSDANNGYYIITSVGSNFVIVTNAGGANQATSGGALSFLPIEWSENILVSEAFTQIVKTYATGLGIRYNKAKIEESTGFTCGGARDHDNVTVQKALETLERMCRGRYAMGVDCDGEFFFKKVDGNVIRKFIMGYDVNKQALDINYDNIKNQINVNRAKGKGETGGGWLTAASSFDATSIAKYGASNKDITVPDFIDDGTAQLIADNELEYLKDPKPFGKITDLKFDGALDIGEYTLVSEFSNYSEIVDEMDSTTNWSVTGSISLTAQDVFLVTGSNALKITANIADNGDYIERTGIGLDIRGKKKIQLWVRSNYINNALKMYISDGINTHSTDINIQIQNQFFFFEWDISGLTLNSLESIKFEVQNLVLDGCDIYLDEITMVLYKSLHTTLPFKKVTYDLKSHEFTTQLELGLQADSLSDFLANQQAAIESHNLLLQDRSNI